MRSFLGAINYYGRFVPNMRKFRYPSDDLLKAGVEFRWASECRKAFESFKSILASDLLLTHYEPRQEIIVSADASSVGLGATLSHKIPDGAVRVVQHASRSLTSAEKAYSRHKEISQNYIRQEVYFANRSTAPFTYIWAEKRNTQFYCQSVATICSDITDIRF